RHDVVLRQALHDPVFVGVAVSALREPVVEEIVVRLERLHLWRALLPPSAVDVEVGEDPQQPGTHVRARRERAPAAERARVRLLHELVSVLARRSEVAGYAVALVGKSERVLLDPDAVARLGRQPLRLVRPRVPALHPT